MLKKLSNSSHFWQTILGLIWFIFIFIINPKGEFPLNDDWAYTKSVVHLIETGQFIMIDWPAMSLIAHVYWGGLFCAIFGFSFFVLRISTLFLGLIAILFLFKLIFRATANRTLAFFGALMLMVNPLFVSLSFSFMTDVPFLAFSLLAVYSFIRQLEEEKIVFLILALVFSVTATLIRQMGLLLPLSFAIVYILTGKIRLRRIIESILPFIITIASLTYYNKWLVDSNKMTYAYQKFGNINNLLVQLTQPLSDTLYFTFLRTGYAFIYAAIFLLPLLIFIAPAILKKQKPILKAIPVWIASFFMFIFFLCFKNNLFKPFPGNVIYNLGIGPKLLKDTYILNLNLTPQASNTFWLIISIIGLIAMSVMILGLADSLVNLITKIKRKESGTNWKALLFIYLVSIIYLGFLVFSYFFDRYFVFLVPFIIIVLLVNYGNEIVFKKKWIVACSGLSFLIITWFSIASTHDYLSWNRARWIALNYLMKDEKISPKSIDGGFEFNCWFETGSFRPVDDPISWWCVQDDEYIISFGKLAKYKTFKKYTFPAMLPGTNNSISILRRDIISPEVISCDLEHFSDDTLYFTTSSDAYQFPVNNLLSTEQSRSGSNSVKISKPDSYSFQFVLKNVLPGDFIEIEVWKRGIDNNVSIIAAAVKDNKFSFRNNNTACKTADTWEPFLLRFYAPENVNDDIAIFLFGNKNGTSYIDDMTVKIYHLN